MYSNQIDKLGKICGTTQTLFLALPGNDDEHKTYRKYKLYSFVSLSNIMKFYDTTLDLIYRVVFSTMLKKYNLKLSATKRSFRPNKVSLGSLGQSASNELTLTTIACMWTPENNDNSYELN